VLIYHTIFTVPGPRALIIIELVCSEAQQNQNLSSRDATWLEKTQTTWLLGLNFIKVDSSFYKKIL
jgi:hypothetical protein